MRLHVFMQLLLSISISETSKITFSPYFTMDRYMMTYSLMMHPIENPSKWLKIPQDDYVMPSKQQKQSDKPQKARKKRMIKRRRE